MTIEGLVTSHKPYPCRQWTSYTTKGSIKATPQRHKLLLGTNHSNPCLPLKSSHSCRSRRLRPLRSQLNRQLQGRGPNRLKSTLEALSAKPTSAGEPLLHLNSRRIRQLSKLNKQVRIVAHEPKGAAITLTTQSQPLSELENSWSCVGIVFL